MTSIVTKTFAVHNAPGMEGSRICAVFDLDETLIRPKSMVAVLEQYHRCVSVSAEEAALRIENTRDDLNRYVKCEPNRSAQNRYFYKQFADIPVADMRRAASEWFRSNRSALYHADVVAHLQAHREEGAVIILVSGSFYEAIAPVAADLRIDHVICARLEQHGGCYTGVMLGEPTIGEGKAVALNNFLQSHALSMHGSFAYGDHESDIPMLSMADHPVAVGTNAALLEHACRYSWRTTHAVT